MRKLIEQKTAIESANEELKRQNKYWEDLFSKQQLQGIPSQEPTRSDISNNSNKGTEESNTAFDLSYESLDMTRGDVMKRSKKSDSGSDLNFLNGRMEQQDSLSDRYVMNQEAGLARTVSFHQNSFEPRQSPVYRGFNADYDDGINVDDVLLERNEQSSFGKL